MYAQLNSTASVRVGSLSVTCPRAKSGCYRCRAGSDVSWPLGHGDASLWLQLIRWHGAAELSPEDVTITLNTPQCKQI